MKKILAKILCCALTLCLLCSSLSACGSSSAWKAGELTNGGEVVWSNGFIAETKEYLYYINGQGSTSADNTFGAPVKGALMAVVKSTIGTENLKTEVVVPKLFSATDKGAGLFIDGGYVYYGTPNVEKNSSGEVAYSEMTFAKTKLDGSGQTETLFTVSAHSTEYRIVKGGEKVYIVYYDAEESALVSFDTVAKTSTVIAKTDDTAKTLSLDSYKFLDEQSKNQAVVAYTTTVYTEEYDEEKASKKDYQRQKATYNQVYLYKAGDTVADGAEVAGKLVLDGKHDQADALDDGTYALTLVKAGYLFFSEKVGSTDKYYGATATELFESKSTQIVNNSYVADANIIISLDKVYTLAENVVYRTTLVESDYAIKKPVAKSETISTMLFIIGQDLYYFNSSNQLARITLRSDDNIDEKVKEIRISEDTVASGWYNPQYVSIGEKVYVFYLDNSTTGASYVKCVDIASPVIEEDEVSYIDTNAIVSMGIMTKDDQAKIFTARIDDLSNKLESGKIVLKNEDGAESDFVKAVKDLKKEYDEISDSEVKAKVSESSVRTLNNYIKAIEIATELEKLEGIQNYNTTDHKKENIPQSIADAYNTMADKIETFKAGENSSIVLGYIENNLLYYYQQAVAFFGTK